jgi:[acyl-carrier-protein] S-malonyltransferase
MPFAILFPGQGSQSVGMGSELFDARPDLLGEAADRVLGWSLREMCLDAPEDELTRTEHAQPALYAVAYAMWDTLRPALPVAPAAAAGHSLGEYTALAAAGAIEYLDGLRLVAERGRAMSAAADAEPSGMAALLGGDLTAAEALAAARREAGGRLWVANLNAPGQVVVAGGEPDIAWAAEHAADHGIRRVIPLKVAGAFHSPFMAPAAERLAAAMEGVDFDTPAFQVWANATAAPHGSAGASIGGALVDQLTSPVRFAESLGAMAASGVTTFVHVGPGDVTAGLARKSVEGAEALVASSPSQVAEVAAALGAS